MSDAKVRFGAMNCDGLDADEPEAGPGQEARFGFACPKHAGRRCEGLVIVGAASGIFRTPEKTAPAWDFDGNRQAPTFSPSINCGGCWHGFIEKGRCITQGRQDEPEPTS